MPTTTSTGAGYGQAKKQQPSWFTGTKTGASKREMKNAKKRAQKKGWI